MPYHFQGLENIPEEAAEWIQELGEWLKYYVYIISKLKHFMLELESQNSGSNWNIQDSEREEILQDSTCSWILWMSQG